MCSYSAIKRFIDICCASCGLVFLGVPLCLLMILVKINSDGPALYWSERVGLCGKKFLMPKIRTMNVNTPELPTHKFEQPEEYITTLGKFLRRTSLDELPQLYSVLIGDMSLVGPRPMIPQYQELVAARQKAGVHLLRPGITGWAQINGRDEISTEQKLALDLEYLNRCSFRLDVLILIKTAIYVFLVAALDTNR